MYFVTTFLCGTDANYLSFIIFIFEFAEWFAPLGLFFHLENPYFWELFNFAFQNIFRHVGLIFIGNNFLIIFNPSFHWNNFIENLNSMIEKKIRSKLKPVIVLVNYWDDGSIFWKFIHDLSTKQKCGITNSCVRYAIGTYTEGKHRSAGMREHSWALVTKTLLGSLCWNKMELVCVCHSIQGLPLDLGGLYIEQSAGIKKEIGENNKFL